MSDELPRTYGEALAWANARARETGEMPKIIANQPAGLVFDLTNRTVTRAVWDEDNNLVEMMYCADTGRVLRKQITKSQRGSER
jgi:hypothetical protein